MPSVLKSALAPGIGTTVTTVFTAGSASTVTIVGLVMANASGVPIKGTAQLKRGATVCNIILNGPIPNGNALTPVGNNGKVILMPNDILQCYNDVGVMDVSIHYLEQT